MINVIDKQEDDWWQGELNGQVGIFPATYVQEIVNGSYWLYMCVYNFLFLKKSLLSLVDINIFLITKNMCIQFTYD